MTTTNTAPAITAQDIRDPDRLKECIRLGADVHTISTWSDAPLALAVRDGLVESCRLLLDAGANPNGCEGEPTLCIVSEARHTELNKYVDGLEPGMSAETMQEICALLVARGADPMGPIPSEGLIASSCCPLFLAAKNGDIELVQCLVALGANVDQQCMDNTSGLSAEYPTNALRHAKDYGREEVMIALLGLGADDSCIKFGTLTGFQHCVEIGQDKVVEYYFRERGEDLHQLARIATSPQTLQELATKESTKTLLRSFEAESVVSNAIAGIADLDEQAARPSRSRGLAL